MTNDKLNQRNALFFLYAAKNVIYEIIYVFVRLLAMDDSVEFMQTPAETSGRRSAFSRIL